jgi:hypothetical protein
MGTIVVNEGAQAQLTIEEITWAIVFTGATSISSVSVTVYQAGTDVTSTVMPTGTASVSGSTVTLPTLKSLTADLSYRIVVTATVDGQPKRGAIFDIVAKDAQTI